MTGNRTDGPADKSATHGQQRELLKGRVIRGTFWFMSATFVRAALRVAVIAMLARLLVPEDFGLVGAAAIFVAVAELFSSSGIVYTIVQRTDIQLRHIRTAFTGNLIAGGLAGLLVWSLSGWIASFMAMPRLEQILALLALLFPLNAVSAVSQKLLERELAFGWAATAEVASYVIGYALVAVPLAWLGFGVWSLAFAQLSAAAVRSALLLYAQPHALRPMFDWRAYLELMRTGAGYSIVRYALYAAHKGDYLVVGRWLGPTPLGLYERAYVLMDLSNSLLASSLQTVLFPAFAKLQADRAALSLAFQRVSALIGLVFLPAGIVASLLAPEIIAVLLGSQWTGAVAPFRILAIGMVFRTGLKVSSILANGVGAPYRNARALVIYAVLVVGGALVSVSFGIAAVAASTLFALMTVFLLLTRLSLTLTGTGWRELLEAYAPALRLSVLVMFVTIATAEPMRHLDAGPVVTLAVSFAAAMVVILLLVRFAPHFFGPHGRWAIATVSEQLPRLRSAN